MTALELECALEGVVFSSAKLGHARTLELECALEGLVFSSAKLGRAKSCAIQKPSMPSGISGLPLVLPHARNNSTALHRPYSNTIPRPSMPAQAFKAMTALEFECAWEDVVVSPAKQGRVRSMSLPIQKSKIEPSMPSALFKRWSTSSVPAAVNPRQQAVPHPATDMSSPPGLKALKQTSRRTSHSSSTRYFAELVRRRQVQLALAKTPINVLSRSLPSSPAPVLPTKSKSVASLFGILILSLFWHMSTSLSSLMMAVATSVFTCFPAQIPWCAASSGNLGRFTLRLYLSTSEMM